MPATSRNRHKMPIQALKTWGRLAEFVDQTAIEFASRDERSQFIYALWQDPTLRELPRAPVGANTIIVPTEAMPLLRLLREKGIQFVERSVDSASDVPPATLARLRREQAPF